MEMIEITIKEFLQQHLTEKVFLEMPENINDERFLILDKTGSSQENHINSSKFALQSYADSKYEAAALNERLKVAMYGLTELDQITSVKINSDYPFPDTKRKKYRYQAVFDITHY